MISSKKIGFKDSRIRGTEVRSQKSDGRMRLSFKIFSSFFNSKFLILNSKLGFKAFTLIELIIFIIIAGIFLPATYVAFSASMRSATQPEDYTRGMLLTEQTMEVATKRGFTQLALDISSPPTCATIGVTAPIEWTGWDINTNCAWTPSFRSFNGSAFSASVSATSYIQIYVSITTPQGNTFTSTGMVTNHVF